MARKLVMIVVVMFVLMLAVSPMNGQAATLGNKVSEVKKEVSPQVTHIQQSYQSGSTRQFVNVLDVNLNNTYTKLEIGMPNPINSLKTTTAMAKQNTTDGHRVVGAVNASYFLGNGMPANLLAENNEIINYGILGDSYDSPTQKPVAFGLSKSGKAIADYYSTQLSFQVNGKNYPIDLINSERGTNKTVLYTPEKRATGTNNWGIEIVVTGASQDTSSLHFGDRFSGMVSHITAYGAEGNSTVPADGFVISVQNKELAAELISSISAGTTIDVSLTIDQKWMDAQFILAAGPMLVRNGKVDISMPTNSGFASTRSPRTAVAIDATGTKVSLVTVDGRLSGHSNGVNLSDLASHLISMGASSALNLDGGGSTAMVVRNPGGYFANLVNKPSEGSERRVSAILQVVNTAPPGQAKSITLSSVNQVMKGSSVNMQVASAYDQYLNPMTINPANMTWTVEGNIGQMNGATFTATQKGEGKIIGEYQGIRTSVPVKVVDLAEKPILLDSFDNASAWTAEIAKAKASLASSKEYARQGTASMQLNYDFTVAGAGTKAAYMVAKSPIAISGQPKNIGVWVFGDGGKHWLRGVVIDGTGTKQTIDFTSQGGLDWHGWKYVTADIPSNLPLPLKFDRLYVAQPDASLQKNGQLYFDQLQAVYKDNHEELVYTDVAKGHWAFADVQSLYDEALIKGYSNGTFKPEASITRAEAATIIARALNLTTTKNSSFKDVGKSHYAYSAIAAVEQAGIIKGQAAGKFNPNGQLSRAEMSAILARAYQLTGTSQVSFKDVKSTHWAYSNIQALVANDLTSGFPDNTFRPDAQITRAQFASFLNRCLTL
ncbi:S-layer homology domain-containing protein [Lysinibacillus sp. FSL K6-0232]|uniref:S-layer homology domain-containing protein n=1 Tax=Lysinibacillus sp. FSL K6-0232 TaxID=2921425 RepID=UPI0030FCE570